MNLTHRWAATARAAGDAALAVVVLAVLAATAAALAASWGGWYWAFGLAVGTVAGTLALLRRRGRFALALAGLGVALAAVVVARLAGLPEEPAPATALALAVLVASAVRRLPVREAVVVAGGGLAVVAASWLAAVPFSAAPSQVTTVCGVSWLAAVAAGLGGRLRTERREAMVERVRRDERLAVARELHDVVAHHITGIVVQAQAARIVAGRSSRPEPLAGPLADIETAGADALASLRRVVGLLRDDGDASPSAPGPEAIGILVSRFEERGPAVCLRLPDDDAGWPPEVTSTVYRVVQEALTNVTRHAPRARSVTVDVGRTPDGIRVEVSDDAPHAAPGSRHGSGSGGAGVGYGLVGMRERVEALGGALRAGSRPDAGWTVLATLPLPADGRPLPSGERR
ncbi:sensor histidine kinase [Myceligenerans pegani]|uniref:histidine kinase n=1 Tax=Myceligenerans pegani TaxID=2776917 RepID=A0ABR9MVX3_9MICO|nr:histidine kinase [Myceligenerans sp. TRM 65318]MBE1875534.1 sensor histidine kinase [Myceligenerans sp. TRM 65318]MBE3017805.1 sensor histidine kinase [Myceligenerans sp. TRM 65318]